MTGDQVTVNMTGGCPWGFRLFGGDEDPLVVAKLRKRSKAHESGLQEGDVLLGINSHSCQGMSHSTAMTLADSSGQNLALLVLRGTSEKHAVHAAFQALGSQLKPVPASAQPQERSSGSSQVPGFQSPDQSQAQPHGQQATLATPGFQSQVRASPLQQSVINGPPGGEVRREQQTLQDGNTTKHITTETRTEQFGGTQLTKITREEVSHTVGGRGGPGFAPVRDEPRRQPAFSAAPHASQPSMFQVSNFGSSQPKPSAWAPSSAPTTVKAGAMTITAPSGVHVQKNPDQSVTMSIGMHQAPNGGKENVAPRPGYQPAAPKPGVWQPSFTPAPPPPRRRSPSPPLEPMQDDSTDFPTWAFPSGNFHRSNAPPALPLHVVKILHDGSGSDECSTPDTPTGMSKKKKLLFGDSAFYDDPQHKYPTIEEQVKMARRVAMSLTAPANTKARGHRMFVKRQQKSHKWTKADEPGEVTTITTTQTYELNDSDDEKYFQSDPWAGTHTWQPPEPPRGPMVRRGEIPQAPPVPMLPNLWSAPVIPKVEEEKSKALSAEEFERMRLYESKTQHTAVSPQACFALADDLRQMKGKGGRLFAKRKARAEKWVHDESTAPPPPASAELIKKLTGGLHVGVPDEPDPAADVRSGAVPVNRLKQMIDLPKPAMTPWEAAMESGGVVDRAFSHLEGITFTRKTGKPGAPTVALDVSSPTSSISTTSSSGPGKMPEFSRKIKPWGESSPSPAGFQPLAPAPAPKPSPRPPPKPAGGRHAAGGQSWAQPDPSGAAAAAAAGGNFRPINFRASGPGGANKAGVFAPWQQNSSGGGGGAGGGGGGSSQPLAAGGDGFCDL